MKRIVPGLIAGIAFLAAALPASRAYLFWAERAVPTDGTDMVLSSFDINDDGHVAWSCEDGTEYSICYYDGSSTTRIDPYIYDDHLAATQVGCGLLPALNNHGQVLWVSFWYLGFVDLYDGSATAELDYDTRSLLSVDLNDSGQAVWHRYDGSLQDIRYHDGSTTVTLDGGSWDVEPVLNECGQVVWFGHDGADYEIFLYDGSATVQITNNGVDDEAPQINDSGTVVWERDADTAADGSDHVIMLYDGTAATQISSGGHFNQEPRINNAGQVAWYAYDASPYGAGGDYEIYLYDGGAVSQITSNTGQDRSPRLNDDGSVVWYGDDGSDMEIFRYQGGATTQITSDADDDYDPQIAENGVIVWRSCATASDCALRRYAPVTIGPAGGPWH